MTRALVRVRISASSSCAEETRARALELCPEGFEETERDDLVDFALYVTDDRLEEIHRMFPEAVTQPVAAGWEDAWRDFHHPVRAGGIWIGPPWEAAQAGEPIVVIDPGRAFGTGAHPTTRLCVELLAVAGRGSLLDVGCGSGVLAIAAGRLGYGPLIAVDDDPVAVETTRANAHANGVTIDAHLVDATIGVLPAAETAVVNILLPEVEVVLGRLRSTRAITSGYLAGERPAAPGWTRIQTRELEGWRADMFRRDST